MSSRQSSNGITEQVAKEPSSNATSAASSHSHHGDNAPQREKAQFVHHQANPGPVILDNFNIPQEGTKEERMAKTAAMNK
jgi:hypothetical protein